MPCGTGCPELGKWLSASKSYSSFPSGARPPGGQLMWLKQVSRHRQAPSRRLALTGTSRTSWYLCLRFYILHSQALPRGSCHGHMCSRARERQAQSNSSQRHGAASPPQLLDASFCVNFGKLKKLGKMRHLPLLGLGCWRPSLLTLYPGVRGQ